MNQRRTILYSIIIVFCLVNWACTHGEARPGSKDRDSESVGQTELKPVSHSWGDTSLSYPYKHRQQLELPSKRSKVRHFYAPEPLLFEPDSDLFPDDSAQVD